MDGSPSPPSTARSGAPPRRWSARRALLALGAVGVVAALAGAALLLGTRSRVAERGAGATTPAAERHVYLLEPADGRRSSVSLEVAADETARERGLSNRAALPAGSGMAFLFPRDTGAAFWMRDTLVPLQIAFVGGDGRVIGLFEMPPCRDDPCPTYAPDRPYRYAIELPSGAFTAAGITQGDRVVPQDPAALPEPS